MTAQPPDPDPARTPGLEPGSGVTPGEIPPDSAQTSGLAEPEPRPRRRFTPTTVTGVLTVALFALMFVAVAVLLVLSMSGLFD